MRGYADRDGIDFGRFEWYNKNRGDAEMKEHGKKKIAPIAVTVIMLIYYGLYFGVIISVLPSFWKVVIGVIPAVFGGTLIYVCVQRIKEIDGGEEDDLSKY